MAEDSRQNLIIDSLGSHPEHLERVAAWHHQECLHQGIASRLDIRRERLAQHLDSSSPPVTLIALQGTRPLGCVSLVRYEYRPAGASAGQAAPVWLSNLYVESAERRQGIGQRLIASATERARRWALSELWLSTLDQTTYYQRLGWVLVRQSRLNGRPVDILRLPLA